MLKEELRLDYLRFRQELAEEGLTEASKRISETCLELPVWDKSLFHLFLTVSEKREIDTSFLKALLRKKGKRIAVPKMAPNRSLHHFLLTDDSQLSPNRWGIPEPIDGERVLPEAIEVVFVPLLAFDEKGYRVGYGGGYYDRFLGQCRKDVITVGLSFFGAVQEISDLHAGDVPLDYVVCAGQIYAF